MRNKFQVLLVALTLICLGRPLVAHHSFSSEYDEKKAVSIKGVVSKVEWTNPHVRIYVDQKDASGTVTTWNMELATPSALTRNGWTSKSLKVGDEVTIKGFAAKNDQPRASAGAVTLADGRSLFAGAAPGADPGAAPAQ